MNAQISTFRGMVNIGAIHKGWDIAISSNSQILSLDLFNEVTQKKSPSKCASARKNMWPLWNLGNG